MNNSKALGVQKVDVLLANVRRPVLPEVLTSLGGKDCSIFTAAEYTTDDVIRVSAKSIGERRMLHSVAHKESGRVRVEDIFNTLPREIFLQRSNRLACRSNADGSWNRACTATPRIWTSRRRCAQTLTRRYIAKLCNYLSSKPTSSPII